METLVCSIFSHGDHALRRIKLPSFVKFSSAVSEEKIFKEKFTDGRRTQSDDSSSHDPLGQVS